MKNKLSDIVLIVSIIFIIISIYFVSLILTNRNNIENNTTSSKESSEIFDETNNTFKILEEVNIGANTMDKYIIVDTDTGVMYLISVPVPGSREAVTMYPLYNADGSLKCYKKLKERN